MGWARFDDHYSDHPKIADAGPWAELLDMRAIIYCARHETDGHIAAGQLQRLGVGIPAVLAKARRLVQVGRWHTPSHTCNQCPAISDGYLVHDYLTYNPSSERKDAERAAARERVRRARDRKTARRQEPPPPEPPDPDTERSEDVRANTERSNGARSPDVRSTPYPTRTPEHPPSPPEPDRSPLDPANINSGGTATPKTNGAHPADHALERIAGAMPTELSPTLTNDRYRPRLLTTAHQALQHGWTPSELVDAVNRPGWRGVANPAAAAIARLADIASQTAPRVAVEKRLAAEQQHDAEKAAEREETQRRNAELDAAIDALPDDERTALAKTAWQQLPRVIRGPEPDLNRPAIRGVARSILAERISA